MADPSLQPYKNGYYLWKYVPSLAAAVVFCLLFVGVTAAHCFRLWRSRLWYCIWFAVGGLSVFSPSLGVPSMASAFLHMSLTTS